MLLIGKLFNLLITKETDKIANIKNDKKTIPKALKFDLKFNTSLVEIINEANIQNWVKKIIGITKSGVNAINLSNPGAWAIPTAIKIFLKVTLVSLSGKILAPIVNIKTAQKNHVKIAVNAERLNEVL